MNLEEQQYLNLLREILETGEERADRTGIGTVSIFGSRLKFSLVDGRIPLLTTKKMATKAIIEELLFFIRGETDTKLLEIKGVNIWRGNTSREFLDRRGLTEYPEGWMGNMYGWQWRNFGGTFTPNRPFPGNGYGLKDGLFYSKDGIDQLSNCLELIKRDPMSRRIMITAYNPKASAKSVLDPCHMFAQFYVSKGKLNCQFYMRSIDTFLGLGFNLPSYAILTHLMAKASGLEAGSLTFLGGDTHIYLNHLEQVKEQLSRDPFPFPTMSIKKKVNSVEDMEQLSFEDFEIHDYQHHPAIKARMAI